MSIPLCNCNNRHFSFLHPKTLNPQIPNCHFPNHPPFISVHRRQISATSSPDNQTLPQSAIHRIAEKLRSLGYVEEEETNDNAESPILSPNSPGEIFVPLRTKLPKYRVGHTLDTSWSTPENPVPEPGSSIAIQRFHEVRRGVLEEKEEERIRNGKKVKGAPSLAELTLPKEELRRLRSEGIGLRKKLKVGKAGITEGIVNGIHERWRRTELVKITCEDICRLNMKRTHDLLERKTGGLVVWRSGSNIILYRGTEYKYPYFLTKRNLLNDSSSEESDLEMDERTLGKPDIQMSVITSVESPGVNSSTRSSQPSLIQGVGLPNRVRFELPGEAQLAEEADALLEGLGPRFNDWWGYDPLPVDADLLPAVVPGYRRPFRLLPYGVKNKLTNDEMTTLRRLCRPLPCHFALGRNRKHQGLAASIVKLWEKCEIAKIAVKRGVQNTNSELMAEELKWLTGGTLLSRDKDFIVFYRGKDFLPAAASSAIEERRKYDMDVAKANVVDNLSEKEHELGTEDGVEVEHNEENGQKLRGRSKEKRLRFPEAAMEKTSTKLSMALEKKARAEKLLAELEKEETRQPLEIDKEGITEEERYMLRKVGLRMKAFLLLGRRGVFDGTVENMHLHWKYRELVKVCIGRRSIEEVNGVARTLEAESGGILVAVEPVSKGYAIIVYRGKNYKRPAILRPQTLLSKREAMKRSLEAQRRESLKLHVLELNRNIDGLKRRLAKDENTNDMLPTGHSESKYVKDEDTNKNYCREDKVFLEDSQSDDQSSFEDTDDEEARESLETDVAAENREDTMHTSKNPEHVAEKDLAGDIYSPSEVKKVIKFDMSAEELEPVSEVQGLKGSLNVNEQSRKLDISYHLRSQEQENSSASTHIRQYTKVMDSDDDLRKVKFEVTAQKSIAEKPAVIPLRNSQLSNRERLLLRKQALKMRKPPVLSIGKSNVVAGVAKAIKQHFEKHPLAIVNIKGRAKGTSIQEVIYNLEQATGAVLVSQEPSKVILYRGWGAGPETGKSRTNSGNGEIMARSIISPELISAIRLECGLDSADEGNFASTAVTDGN